jgi:hypothetical protein
MNLSKALKRKRDDEERLKNRSPQTVFKDNGTEQFFLDISNFATKAELASKADINHNHDEVYAKINEIKYFEPITNGDSTSPEIVFFNGDVVMGEVI